MQPSSSLGQQGQTKFSFLLTFAIVSFTKVSVLPWMIHFLHAKKYESWAQVVVIYGFLATALNLGVSIGSYMSTSHKELSNTWFLTLFLTLIVSYTLIGLVSRLFVIFCLIFLVGLSGSLLSGYSLNLDKFSPTLKFHKKYADNHYNINLERSIVSFIFATLLSSVIYDDSSKVDFPAYLFSLILALIGAGMMIFYIILASSIANANKSKTKGLSGTGSNSHFLTFKSGTPIAKVDIEVPYEGNVPVNFLSFCKGNIQTARVMYGKTLAWRRKHDVDNIFTTPQRFFSDIIQYYPHGIHGYSLDGCQVVYEILGKGKPRELEATGITIDELVWHFNLRNELIFRKLLHPEFLRKYIEKSPAGAISLPTPNYHPRAITPQAMTHLLPYSSEGDKMYVPRMMTVIDVEGIGLRSITGHVVAFIQKSGEVIDNYYPEQVSRLVVVNAPWGFGSIFGMIAPALPAAVQKKVDILSSVQELSKYIHASQRPVEYGGTDVPLGQWEGHKMFLELAENWKQQQPVMPAGSEPQGAGRAEGGVQRSSSNSESRHHSPTHATPSLMIPSSTEAVGSIGSPSLSRQSSSRLDSSQGQSHGKQSSSPSKKKSLISTLLQSFSSSNNNNKDKDKKKAVPSEAFLGEQNQYQYNEATGLWELTKTTTHHSRHHDTVDTEEEEELGYYSAEEDGPLAANKALDSNGHHKEEGNHHDSSDYSSRGGGGNSSSRPKRKDTMDEIEEHGMVLAIQASHIAKSIIRTNNNNKPLSMSTSHHLLPHHHYLGNSMELGALSLSRGVSEDMIGLGTGLSQGTVGGGESGLGGDHHAQFQQQSYSSSSSTNSSNTKLSSTIFLIASFIFLLSTSIQNILISLLPLFLCSPLQSGGLGYGPRDLGLQLSFAGVVVLVLFQQLQGKCDHILRASPVRALRIACGILSLALMMLFAYIRNSTVSIEDILHHAHEGAHYGLEEHEHRASIHHSLHHNGLLEPELLVISALYNLLPSTSTVSMIIIGVLLACMITAAHVSRRAAGMLFHLVLSSVFQQPQSIRLALCSVLDTIAPLLYCSLTSLIYAAHLKFPVNSSFFLLPVTLSFALWIYIASVFLVIQFRGDYGVMSDHHHQEWKLFSRYYGSKGSKKGRQGQWQQQEEHYGQGLILRRGDFQQQSDHGNHRNGWAVETPLLQEQSQQQQQPQHMTSTGEDIGEELAGAGEDEHIMTIPLGDINLLFSAGSSGYGSKLFNLKDDFKDV